MFLALRQPGPFSSPYSCLPWICERICSTSPACAKPFNTFAVDCHAVRQTKVNQLVVPVPQARFTHRFSGCCVDMSLLRHVLQFLLMGFGAEKGTTEASTCCKFAGGILVDFPLRICSGHCRKYRCSRPLPHTETLITPVLRFLQYFPPTYQWQFGTAPDDCSRLVWRQVRKLLRSSFKRGCCSFLFPLQDQSFWNR